MSEKSNRLREWRKITENATSGPWLVMADDCTAGVYYVAEHVGDDITYDDNAKFISMSRVVMPLLLDLAEAVDAGWNTNETEEAIWRALEKING